MFQSVSGKRLGVDGVVTLGGEQMAVTGKHLDIALNDWQRVDLGDPLLGLGL
jgi:aspartate aminotransferase-like enzyme